MFIHAVGNVCIDLIVVVVIVVVVPVVVVAAVLVLALVAVGRIFEERQERRGVKQAQCRHRAQHRHRGPVAVNG